MIRSAVLSLLTICTAVFAGKFDSAVRAFESQPGYVQPIATVLGTFGGMGWQNRSAIPVHFSGSVSLPITISILHDNDRLYTDIYTDKGMLQSNLPDEEKEERAYTEFTAPTIFGTMPAPTLSESILDADGNIVRDEPVYFSDGIDELAAFNWIPLPTIQADFSTHFTSLKLRYLGKPGKDLGIHYPGIGVQHDLRSFLPELPLNLTLFGNFSIPIINWTPGEGIEGTLEMRGLSVFSGMTVGQQFSEKRLDCFLELGWEYSRLSTGGELYIIEDDETVVSNLTLRGRNRFRMSLVVAFNPGKRYRISGTASVGAEQALSITPLAVRFEKDNTDIQTDDSDSSVKEK